MRQGEVAPKGAWTGNPSGGVKAPETIVLPVPAARFRRTADRLDALADGHPMADWLRFMAELARAQHAAATAPGTIPGPTPEAVHQAVEARMPPLAADGHRRDPTWRDALRLLLEGLAQSPMPEPARATVARLAASDAATLEALADAFLSGSIAPADVAPTLYVAAALQVYFTRLAAALPVDALRLLPERGLCPCCGSTPVAGIVTATGQSPGARYLHCSLCATAWNHTRAVCITCGQSRTIAVKGIEGANGAIKAETCDECHTYAKMLYQAKDTAVDAVADDLASLGLDMLVSEAGWLRHAPNPLLLVG